MNFCVYFLIFFPTQALALLFLFSLCQRLLLAAFVLLSYVLLVFCIAFPFIASKTNCCEVRMRLGIYLAKIDMEIGAKYAPVGPQRLPAYASSTSSSSTTSFAYAHVGSPNAVCIC